MRDFIASQNSERLRQRLSGSVQFREPAAFTRLAKSIVEIAVVTGIVARLYRMIVVARTTTGAGTTIALAFGGVFLLLMAALHLSRFPLRDWVWRAPAFAVIESSTEMVASLVLIALGREAIGTRAAHWSDWPGMAAGTIGWRVITIPLFAAILALTVKWVRYVILRNEHAAWSDGTVRAGIPGERLMERRKGRPSPIDPLLLNERRKPDNKRS
jgi:hypothetical protein